MSRAIIWSSLKRLIINLTVQNCAEKGSFLEQVTKNTAVSNLKEYTFSVLLPLSSDDFFQVYGFWYGIFNTD